MQLTAEQSKPILSDYGIEKPLTLIGLMSGTSVDAVDACCVELWVDTKTNQFCHHILGTYTHPMPDHLKQRLLNAMSHPQISFKELGSLNSVVGILFADTVYGLLNSNGLKRENITAIASHGQTLFHEPPQGEGVVGHTLQIGSGATIAEYTGIRVINDFRVRDMAVGGQGAPLVCFADALLFQNDQTTRCIQNIGGIANVTVLPSDKSIPIKAFDTGPGNVLIDGAMTQLFNQAFDKDGQTAASGTLDSSLLTFLLDNPYFNLAPPKSTGRELFSKDYLNQILTQFAHLKKEDLIATLTAFTAKTIVDAYQRFIIKEGIEIHEMILGGGGVKNKTLLGFIRRYLDDSGMKDTLIKSHQDYGISDQYKEALAFAVLGWATLLGIPNNIPSCTGATRPAVLGQIIT